MQHSLHPNPHLNGRAEEAVDTDATESDEGAEPVIMARLVKLSDEAKLAWTIVWRALLFFVTFISACGWVLSDRHNDDRYITNKDHAAERTRDAESRLAERLADKELREINQKNLDRQIAELSAQLKDVLIELKQRK